jgi:hypothetical protein
MNSNDIDPFTPIRLPFFPFLQKFFALAVVPFYLLFLRRQRPSAQTLVVLLCLCLGAAFSCTFFPGEMQTKH